MRRRDQQGRRRQQRAKCRKNLFLVRVLRVLGIWLLGASLLSGADDHRTFDSDKKPLDTGGLNSGDGRVKVGKNLFFEFADGGTFYPIAAANRRDVLRGARSSPAILRAYLTCLAEHGVNAMIIVPSESTVDDPYHSLVVRDSTVEKWATDILDDVGSGGEERNEAVDSQSRRLRSVNVGNLQRFNWWDPERAKPNPNPNLLQAAYLDNPRNDYIDYHLYTWNRSVPPEQWFTEYPSDAYTPIKYYLGVNVGVDKDLGTSHCTLPEIIDHNRYAAPGQGHRLGGFFSSEFGLLRWEDPSGRGYPRKRFLSDCNHNYIWLGLATGSVGGPTARWPAPSPVKTYYDLSGVNYLNPTGEALNYYTDEILDSMLSLNRFTSLVNWKLIGALYRPMRITKDSGGPGLELRSTTSGLVLPENEWLWSAASDTRFTVGWIVRNCPRNYDIPESSDSLTAKPAPRVHIINLALMPAGQPLELVWFDDHLGQIVGSRSYSTSGTFNVVTPNTEGKNGFARSIAFLIQPTGLTASKTYTALPDEKIGQIEVTPPVGDWYEERQYGHTYTTLTFKARTKPAIANLQGWRFEWRSFSETSQPTVVQGNDQLTSYCTTAARLIKVDIYDPQNRRVSGDIIQLELLP